MKDGMIVAPSQPSGQTFTAGEPALPAWLPKALLVIARITIGYLFFAQLLWKPPPSFHCAPDYHFTTANPNGSLNRTSGLCDWIGIESVWATRPRSILRTDELHIGVPIGWASRLNGVFLDNVVKPNIRWFGYLIWGSEAFIFVSLFFGLFGRLGGLVAIGISAQLVVGLAGISDPNEWEWGYNLIFLLSVLLFAFPPGRIFGLDALLRPRLRAAAANGNGVARVLLLLT